MNQQLKWMKKILLVAIVMLAGIWLQPMEAKAQLHEIAFLNVAGVEMVKDGEVLVKVVEDGMGGSATYDEKTNTLTLNNFHYIEGSGTWDYICSYFMSHYQKLTVELKGTNDLRRSDRIHKEYQEEQAAMYLEDHVSIEGMGKLITNTKVTVGTCEIKDCTIEIQGVYHGMYVPYGMFINNADVTISNDTFYRRTAALYLDGGPFEIKDSILKVKSNTGSSNCFFVRIDEEQQVKDSEQWIKLGDDMVVTDEEGNSLNTCGFDFWGNYYLCFSKDGVAEEYINGEDLSASVHMVSAKKSALTAKIKEVQNLIDAIGTVQLDSEEKIKAARAAYDGLSSLGEQAEYAKSQVWNVDTLTQAEATYAVLVQEKKAAEEAAKKAEEEKKAAEEAAQKAEEENKATEKEDNKGQKKEQNNKENNKENQGDKKKEESLKEKEDENGATTGDKILTIKKKKYVIKTPKLKSVKSTKKKTVTIQFSTNKNDTGYQIRYAQNKKFKKAKTVTVKNKTKKASKINKTTIKKLKSKKNYYIKIRAYRKVNGKTYYGNWSKIKKVRVK